MIVDDAVFMRIMLRSLVQECEYEIIAEAENGMEAVSLYKKYCPDVIIMDITMPEMDGIEATKAILSIDPKAKVVMCSALGQHHIVLDAIKAGAKDFIVKPFDADRVIATLQKVVCM
ncbi:response regulator [Paenibacillus cremeus]|nr:response regulator [Paenibacillus cremeus]